MGDTRDGRDKKGLDEENRAIERAAAEELARYHETEPPRELEEKLETIEYPAPAEQVVEEVGDHEVAAGDETIPVAEVVQQSVRDRYESAADVRLKLRRPSVAVAMRRLEAVTAEAGLREQFRERRDAYQKTLRALEDVEEDDEDEGIAVVVAWVVEQMREKGKVPKSRRLRNRAAEFCRENGYPVSDNSWLGA